MKFLKIFFLLLFLQFSLHTAMAQMDEPTEYVPFEVKSEDNGNPTDPDCDPGDDSCRCIPDQPHCIPIDGGVVALLAAGVGYGFKRVRSSRRNRKEE